MELSEQEMVLSEQEIELLKQEMELFLPDFRSENFFYKMFPIYSEDSKTSLNTGNGIIQTRNEIVETGNGIIQTGNGIIPLTFKLQIKKLLLQNVSHLI